jgi:hypothetical protein
MVSVMGSFIADAVIVVHRDHGPLGFAGLDTSTDRATEVLQGLSDEDVLALPDLLGFPILGIDALAV